LGRSGRRLTSPADRHRHRRLDLRRPRSLGCAHV